MIELGDVLAKSSFVDSSDTSLAVEVQQCRGRLACVCKIYMLLYL